MPVVAQRGWIQGCPLGKKRLWLHSSVGEQGPWEIQLPCPLAGPLLVSPSRSKCLRP